MGTENKTLVYPTSPLAAAATSGKWLWSTLNFDWMQNNKFDGGNYDCDVKYRAIANGWEGVVLSEGESGIAGSTYRYKHGDCGLICYYHHEAVQGSREIHAWDNYRVILNWLNQLSFIRRLIVLALNRPVFVGTHSMKGDTDWWVHKQGRSVQCRFVGFPRFVKSRMMLLAITPLDFVVALSNFILATTRQT